MWSDGRFIVTMSEGREGDIGKAPILSSFQPADWCMYGGSYFIIYLSHSPMVKNRNLGSLITVFHEAKLRGTFFDPTESAIL